MIKTVILIFLLLQSVLCLDYYEALEVPRDATDSQIKKQFRKLSLKYHPDQNPSPEAKQKYIEISTAYEALSDPEKRRIYDQYGEEGLAPGKQPGGFSPFEDLFGGFGGFKFQNRGGGAGNMQQKGPDLELDLEVSLKDLYLGKILEVAHRKQRLCQKCRGSGAKKATDVKTCSGCNGSGTKVKVQQLGPGFMQQIQTTCDECGGKGKKVTSTCPFCKGKKVETGEDNLLVTIERGMADGEKIHFNQQADEGPDMTPGDLVFRLVTIPHKKFTRRGDDLHYSLTISLLEALVGFSKKIRHLDGHLVEIKREDVTKPAQVITIEDEGMPNHSYPSQLGKLHVEITVKMPQSITEEQKEGFKKLLGGEK